MEKIIVKLFYHLLLLVCMFINVAFGVFILNSIFESNLLNSLVVIAGIIVYIILFKDLNWGIKEKFNG